jgi:hypothetical protein
VGLLDGASIASAQRKDHHPADRLRRAPSARTRPRSRESTAGARSRAPTPFRDLPREGRELGLRSAADAGPARRPRERPGRRHRIRQGIGRRTAARAAVHLRRERRDLAVESLARSFARSDSERARRASIRPPPLRGPPKHLARKLEERRRLVLDPHHLLVQREVDVAVSTSLDPELRRLGAGRRRASSSALASRPSFVGSGSSTSGRSGSEVVRSRPHRRPAEEIREGERRVRRARFLRIRSSAARHSQYRARSSAFAENATRR